MSNDKIILRRREAVSVALAVDEFEFYNYLADQLNVSVASIIRNATIAGLISSADPVDAARNNHVTEIARLTKWRRERGMAMEDSDVQPVSPPVGAPIPPFRP